MKLTWTYGALALGALVLAALAEPVRGLAPAAPELHKPANPAEPHEDDPCDEENPCQHIPPGEHTYTLQPNGGEGCGDCIITPDGRKVRNTGGASVTVKTGADGEITEINLGESGEVMYEGDGGNFKVTGGGACGFYCAGDYNTVEVVMGGPAGGGQCTFWGQENSVTNTPNGYPTTFTSDPYEPGQHNDIHLPPGEKARMSGPWVYF